MNIKSSMPMNIDLLPYTIPFFLIGYYGYKPCKKRVITMKWYIALAIALVVISFNVVISTFSYTDVFGRVFGENLIVFFVGGITGSMAIILISYILSLRKTIIADSLSFIGKNSLDYLIFHQQIVVHPINSSGIDLGKGVYNFLMRFVPALGLSSVFALIMQKFRSWRHTRV